MTESELARLFPQDVVVEAEHPSIALGESLQQEIEGSAHMVPARQAQYLVGRLLARRALARFGLSAGAIGVDPSGAPVWPDGFVGAITHCPHLVAVAVGRTTDWRGLGIDAEIAQRPLRQRARRILCTGAEQERLATLPASGINWLLLTFSAKESIYKALPAECRALLGFLDVELRIDPGARTFRAATTASAHACRDEVGRLEGRFGFEGDVLLTSALSSA